MNFVLVVTVLAFTPLVLVKLGKKAMKESNPELWELWEKQQHRSSAVEGAASSSAPSPLHPPSSSTPILRSDLAKHKSVEDRIHALETLVLELRSKGSGGSSGGSGEPPLAGTPSTPPLPPQAGSGITTPPSTTP